MRSRLDFLKETPSLVVADERGRLFDVPELALGGREGGALVVPAAEAWIPLPPGSDLFHLPGRRPVGMDRESAQPVTLEQYGERTVLAAAAFLAPAHTLFYHPAYETLTGAPTLPLYAYCAVGWQEGRFVVPAVRIDSDVRQDHDQYDIVGVERVCTFVDRNGCDRFAHGQAK